MKAIKRVLNAYLMGAAMLFDFTGLFFPTHRPIPPRKPPQDALIGDYLAVCGDMRRAFARLEQHYQKVDA